MNHRCSSKSLCRNKNGEGHPKAIDKPEGFCDRCSTAIKAAYAEAAHDYTRLQAALVDVNAGMHSAAGKVSGTPEPPMPLNGSAITLQVTLAELCEASVALVAKALKVEAKVRQKKRGYPPRDIPVIEQASRIIPEHLDRMLEAEPVSVKRWDSVKGSTKLITGTEVALQVWMTHQKTLNLIGLTRRRTRLAMPCPVLDCGRKTLGIDEGSSSVTCSSCGGRWTDREYQWLSNLLIEDVTRKEIDLLEWLVAEANWKLTQANSKLDKVQKIADMQSEDLKRIESWAIVAVLKEILA